MWKMTLGNQLCRGMIHILHMASKAQMLTPVSGGPRTENFRNLPHSHSKAHRDTLKDLNLSLVCTSVET